MTMFHVNANLTHVALSSRARSLLANLVLGALLLPMLSPLSKTAYGVSSAIPPITATHDGHVRGSNANEASLEGIFLKNAHPTSITNNRFGYARFEYNPNYQWNSASFEMTVSANDGGENPDTWGSSMTTFNVDVWGLSAADWDNDSLLHNTAKDPDNDWGFTYSASNFPPTPNDTDDYLGAFAVPTRSDTKNETFSLANQALVDFLNDDADGEVTLFFIRSDQDDEANLLFHSLESTDFSGPRIVVPSESYTYTVSYDANGGSGTLPSPGTYTSGSSGYTVEAATNLTPPSGKAFVGWNTAADGNGDNFSVGSTYETAASVTLYAQYSASTQTVTFDANGGSGSMSDQTVNSGVATAINAHSFTRSGHSFSGWNTAADGSGTAYSNGANLTTSSDVTLFAQWTAVSVVTFDANGGSGSMSDQTVNSGVATAINAHSFTRSGHSFSGWNTAADGSGTAYSNGANLTTSSDVTLYAQWTVVDSSIGGSSGSDDPPPEAPVAKTPSTPTTPSLLPDLPQRGPNVDPVPRPVERLGLVFDPDAKSRATIGGRLSQLVGDRVTAGSLELRAQEFWVGMRLDNGVGAEVLTDTPSQSPELYIPQGQSAAVVGGGTFPGSFVQLFLPGSGDDFRELTRIPVNPDGTFDSGLSFESGALEMPVPIGRQVLQIVGYDEQGNQTVVDMTINIGQGVPAPEPNRQEGELPALAAGQSLATSGGIPETVSVTGIPETGSVFVEGSGWVASVSVDRDNGEVEMAEGTVMVRLNQSSVGTTSGSGFLPGTLATVWLFSEPTLMKTVKVDEHGEFSSEFLVDARLIGPGEHTLQVQGVGADGYIKAANLGVLVEQPVELTTESASSIFWWVLAALVLIGLVVVFWIAASRRRQA